MNKSEKGAITVFISAILLVMVTLEGFAIDAFRLMTGRSVSSDAGKLSMNAVLADYDRNLFEYYDLFSVSSVPAADADAKIAFSETMNPSTGSNFHHFNSNISVTGLNGSRLSDPNVFESQIYGQMKYYSNTLLDEEKYFYGMEYVNPMIHLLEEKFQLDYDLKLLQDYVNEYNENPTEETKLKALETLDRVNQGISETRSAVTADLTEDMVSYIVDDLDLIEDRLNSTNFRDRISSGDLSGFANEKSENYDSYESAMRADLYWGKKGESIVTLPGSVTPYAERKVGLPFFIEDHNEDEMKVTTDVISSLKSISNIYKNVDAAKAQFNSDFNGNLCLVSYMVSHFTSFKSQVNSVTGATYDFTAFPSAWSEQEYLLSGGSDPNENVKEFYSRIRDFCFIFEMMEGFSIYGKQIEARDYARSLTDTEGFDYYLNKDMYLISEACMETIFDTADDDSIWCRVNLYRGNNHYIEMEYTEFLRMMMVYDVLTEKDAYLVRMENLITQNMRALGNPSFSFSNAYSMVSLDADISERGMFLNKVSYGYHGVDGY